MNKVKKQKRALKESGARQSGLKKDLSVARGKLTATEKKLTKATERADRWKDEAKAQRTAAARAGTKVEKLHKRLDQVSAAVQPAKATDPIEAAASARPAAEPTTPDGVTVPDKSWTVVQLRAEARSRGLVGMSNKQKSVLLNALS